MSLDEYYGTVVCFHEELQSDLLVYGEHFHDQYGDRVPPEAIHAERRAEIEDNGS